MQIPKYTAPASLILYIFRLLNVIFPPSSQILVFVYFSAININLGRPHLSQLMDHSEHYDCFDCRAVVIF